MIPKPAGFRDDPVERELVAGVATGHRVFGWTRDGRLTGWQWPAPWVPGWNSARCLRDAYGIPPCFFVTDWSEWMWSHIPAAVCDDYTECSCGCWGYARGWPNEYEGLSRSGQYPLPGIIEARGRVEVHEGGFRAESARIVALTLPGRMVPAPLGVCEANDVRPKIIARYPDVAIYADAEEMRAAHPPDPPEVEYADWVAGRRRQWGDVHYLTMVGTTVQIRVDKP